MEEAEETVEAKPKKSKKKLLLILALVLLLGGGGAGVFFSGILGGKKTDDAAAGKADADTQTAAAETVGVFHELPDILINVDGNGKASHFLKLKVVLEVGTKADEDALDKVMPRVIDQFQTYLREMRTDDLKGSAGMYRLRQELLTRVSVAVKPVVVKDVLFRDFLIQ